MWRFGWSYVTQKEMGSLNGVVTKILLKEWWNDKISFSALKMNKHQNQTKSEEPLSLIKIH